MSDPNAGGGYPSAYQPSHARQSVDPWGRPMPQPAPVPQPQQPQQASTDPLDLDRKAGPLAWAIFAGVILLLVAGLGIGAYVVLNAEPAAQQPEALPLASASASVSPSSEAATVTVHKPATLTGLPEYRTDKMKVFSSTVEKQVLAKSTATKAVSGSYGKPPTGKLRMFVAGEIEVPPSALVQQDLVDLLDDRATNVVSVPPGSLGGLAACGAHAEEGLKYTVCAWADRGSFGMVFFINEKLTSSVKADFVKARGEIESVG